MASLCQRDAGPPRQDLPHPGDLGAPVLIENGFALVPVHGLAQSLPRLLNATVDFRESARRLLIAGVATDFSAEVQGNPSRLVLHFSRPVNPNWSWIPSARIV